MVANQTKCSKLEQRSVIKLLMAENCKPCEITEETVMRPQKHALVKNINRWIIFFKENRNSIQKEDRPGGPTTVSIAEMVDPVNALNLADRLSTTEESSEQLIILVSTAHKTYIIVIIYIKNSYLKL